MEYVNALYKYDGASVKNVNYAQDNIQDSVLSVLKLSLGVKRRF